MRIWSRGPPLEVVIQLRINNSWAQISGLSREQFRQLGKKLSYLAPGKPGVKWVTVREGGRKKRVAVRQETTIRKYLMDSSGRFPGGLVRRAERWLGSTPYERIDNRIRPKTMQMGQGSLFRGAPAYAPYPEQIEAAEAAVARGGQGILVAPTGFGKSMIVKLILDAFQVPSLIVVPRVGLKKQLTKDLRDSFGADMVGPLVNGERKYFFTVENLDQLDTKKKHDFDLVIIDEFHHAGAKTYRDLNAVAWADVYLKFGLTATPFRSQSEEQILMESVLSEVIYEVPYGVAVDKNYIVPFEAYYIDLPAVEVKGAAFDKVYKELVVNRKDKNKITAELVARLTKAQVPTLVLTKQIEHGSMLQEMLEDLGHWVPYLKGENDDNDIMVKRFNALKDTTIVGTTGVIGEGVDTKPCEYVVLATTMKSKNLFMQAVGRVFRMFTFPDGTKKASGKLIFFRDESHAYTLSHFEACCRYLEEEYGVTAQKLEIEL